MAALNFFDGFNATWAQDGSVHGWTAAQYKTGWAVIGDTKPSVEQFNNTHQLIDQKANYLFRQLKTAATDRSVPIAGNRDDTLKGLFDKLKSELLETQYPVGCVEIMTTSTTPAQRGLPGLWEKITDGFLYPHGAPQAGSLGSTGGSASITLSVAQLPPHSHTMGSAGNHSHSGTTGNAGNHEHTRGSMNITGEFGTRKTGLNTVGSITGATSGAFGLSGDTGASVARVNVYEERPDLRDKVTFDASRRWTGSTSTAGNHNHPFSTNTTGNHTHSINNTGSGASINIMPPRLTVYMWKRVS